MSKPSFDIIPLISLHPGAINIYNEVVWSPYRPNKPKIEHLLKSDKKTHGKVSIQARRKVGKAIDYLLYLANDKVLPETAIGKSYKFKIAFITLTLPSKQIHSDNYLKDNCLNQFLVELRQRYKVRNYIWRAEKQKNGNIHFHILVDKFIHWSELRDRWNRIINKLGYVERYRDEMREFHKTGFTCRKDLLKHWDYQKQIKAYQKGKINDWNSPNSTDIHSLYKINNVKSYIVKYCTKEDTENEVTGRMWGCNYELSDIKGGVMVMDNDIKSQLDEVIKEFKPRMYSGEYFSVIHINIRKLENTKYERLFRIFEGFLREHFPDKEQTRIIHN
jgi:hypothetical protein